MAADPTFLRSFNIRQQLSRLGALVCWWEWSDPKLPLYLVAMSYAVLRMEHLGAAQAVRMAVLLVLLSLFAAFGHIINDYTDREADRTARKHRILAQWSESAALVALAIPSGGASGRHSPFGSGLKMRAPLGSRCRSGAWPTTRCSRSVGPKARPVLFDPSSGLLAVAFRARGVYKSRIRPELPKLLRRDQAQPSSFNARPECQIFVMRAIFPSSNCIT
jgi:hypothetical protein